MQEEHGCLPFKSRDPEPRLRLALFEAWPSKELKRRQGVSNSFAPFPHLRACFGLVRGKLKTAMTTKGAGSITPHHRCLANSASAHFKKSRCSNQSSRLLTFPTLLSVSTRASAAPLRSLKISPGALAQKFCTGESSSCRLQAPTQLPNRNQ